MRSDTGPSLIGCARCGGGLGGALREGPYDDGVTTTGRIPGGGIRAPASCTKQDLLCLVGPGRIVFDIENGSCY